MSQVKCSIQKVQNIHLHFFT